ncbi:alpha/beta fold hydrolase, partial [Balneolaceae bacterium ANBcel3]|nr:alpha/beta fold hydrolase [Balneolaceae bacterium ANBcel3]
MNSSSAVSMIPLPWLKTALALSLLFLMLSCNTIEIREQSVFDAHRTITPVDFDIPEFTLHQQTIVTDDGQHLDSWFLEHKKASATVLYIGGSGFLMVKSRPLIEAYAQAGVHLMLFDFRGYGKSSGEPSVAGLKKDVESVFEFIEQKQADKETQTGEAMEKNLPVFIHGHSMGSLLAGWLANKKPVSGCI